MRQCLLYANVKKCAYLYTRYAWITCIIKRSLS